MIADVIVVSVVGGIFCLDRMSVLFMVSRPIVAAPAIGFLLGDPYTGLVAGAFTELLWIDRLPIGMYQPPNDTIVAILVAASSIVTGRFLGIVTDSLIVLSVLLFVPCGLLAQKMDRSLVAANAKLAERFSEDLKNNRSEYISRRHLFPLFKTWAYSAGFMIAALFIGITLLNFFYPLLPLWSIRGLALLHPMIPLIGTAAALNSIKARGALPVFCGAFLLGSFLFHYLKEMG